MKQFQEQQAIRLTAQARTRMDRRFDTYFNFRIPLALYHQDQAAWQQAVTERSRLQRLYLQAGKLWAKLHDLTPAGKAEQEKYAPPQDGTYLECAGQGSHDTEWGDYPCGSCDGTYWRDEQAQRQIEQEMLDDRYAEMQYERYAGVQ